MEFTKAQKRIPPWPASCLGQGQKEINREYRNSLFFMTSFSFCPLSPLPICNALPGDLLHKRLPPGNHTSVLPFPINLPNLSSHILQRWASASPWSLPSSSRVKTKQNKTKMNFAFASSAMISTTLLLNLNFLQNKEKSFPSVRTIASCDFFFHQSKIFPRICLFFAGKRISVKPSRLCPLFSSIPEKYTVMMKERLRNFSLSNENLGQVLKHRERRFSIQTV